MCLSRPTKLCNKKVNFTVCKFCPAELGFKRKKIKANIIKFWLEILVCLRLDPRIALFLPRRERDVEAVLKIS